MVLFNPEPSLNLEIYVEYENKIMPLSRNSLLEIIHLYTLHLYNINGENLLSS